MPVGAHEERSEEVLRHMDIIVLLVKLIQHIV